MKKADKAYRTKRQLADALKRALKDSPIEKVRIRQLTDATQIHRQSFYYHFEDINALLAWSAKQDIEDWLGTGACDSPWKDRLLKLLYKLREDRNYFLAVQNSPACSDIQTFFREKLGELLDTSGTGHEGPETARETAHIAAQSTITLLVLEQWGCGKLELSPEEIVSFIESQLDSVYHATPAEMNVKWSCITKAHQKQPESQTCGLV